MERKADDDNCAEKRAKLDREGSHTSDTHSLPKRASLLGLPAELRNAILEHVLIEEDFNEPPMIDAASTLPGILRTNRQLRHEGYSMFVGNPFAITIHDMKLEPHPGHWVFKDMGDDWPHLHHTGEFSRSNFKQWLRLFFDGKNVPRIYESEPELGHHNMTAQPFIIVETLAKSGASWSAVETVLNAYFDGTQYASWDDSFEWTD